MASWPFLGQELLVAEAEKSYLHVTHVCVCVHASTGQGAGTHECWDWSDPLLRLQDSGTEGGIECGANMGKFGGRCATGCVWVSGCGWTVGRGLEGRLGPVCVWSGAWWALHWECL